MTLRARRAAVALDAATRDALTRSAARDGALHATEDLVVVGLGRARTITLEHGLADEHAPATVATALETVPLDGDGGPDGTGVVAMAALPFDAHANASLVVPRLLCAWRPGTPDAWATLVAAVPDDPGAAAQAAASGVPATAPATSVVARAERPEAAAYAEAVRSAVAAIAAGALHKVVLARAVVGRCAAPIDAARLAATLQRLDPACDCYAYPDGGGRFVGASPELVVATADGAVTAHPLAGTVRLAGDGDDDARADWLLGSAKNRAEHAVVVDDVVARLEPFCEALHAASTPTVVRLSTNARLGTWVDGKLAGAHDARAALTVLAALHPTPAVGGTPRQAALEVIAAAEPLDRGPWAGPVGWVDADGASTWTLGLRGVRAHGARFEVWGGAGIVAGSDADDERDETAEKLASVLRALSA